MNESSQEKQYEITIDILNKDYIDSLIVALARQGYAPYINEEDNAVCFTISETDLYEIRPKDKIANL